MRSTDVVLLLSQDYELFFHNSGAIEKCLFEPSDALLKFARRLGLKCTFFVDAGMLVAYERERRHAPELADSLSKVQRHIESLAKAGHEVALHVHPHWEDSRWRDGRWDFAGTRYQLRDFDDDDVSRIVTEYSAALASLSGAAPTSFRAGGFCVEPFAALGQALAANGILIDSSVVPGASLDDPDKGFNFGAAQDKSWWTFDQSPLLKTPHGKFVEVPITPQRLPFFYYWQRLLQRLSGSASNQSFGDGSAKRIGAAEIVRRLTGRSRVAELSIDDAKAQHLLARRNMQSSRNLWHVMGHPKLLSPRSLEMLERFSEMHGIDSFPTVTEFARQVRPQDRPAIGSVRHD